MDYSPPASSVHEIIQARILEWVASLSPGDLLNPRSNTGSNLCLLGHLHWQVGSLPLACDLPTVAWQSPLSMEFSRQEYWLPCPPAGALPGPGIEPALTGTFFVTAHNNFSFTSIIIKQKRLQNLTGPFPLPVILFLKIKGFHGHPGLTWSQHG